MKENDLVPCVIGRFKSTSVDSLGFITLLVKVGEHIVDLELLILSTYSPYNDILGRPALNTLKARVSTWELTMEIPMS